MVSIESFFCSLSRASHCKEFIQTLSLNSWKFLTIQFPDQQYQKTNMKCNRRREAAKDSYHPSRTLKSSTFRVDFLNQRLQGAKLRVDGPAKWGLWRLTASFLPQTITVRSNPIQLHPTKSRNKKKKEREFQNRENLKLAYTSGDEILPKDRVVYVTLNKEGDR